MAKKEKEKKPKTVRQSMLRDFTKQYRHKFIAGYLYIECPMICTSYLNACKWVPKDEFVEEVNTELNKLGITITMACVFSRLDNCYFVVSHIWLTQMYLWTTPDMKLYIEKIFSTMLKNAYKVEEEPVIVIKKETYAEKQKDVTEKPQIVESKSTFLEKLHTQVEEESFEKKYGLSLKTYRAMCNDSIVEEFEEETHILVLHKLLFNKYRVLLRDTNKVLVDNGIIIQDMNDPNYKSNYFLAKEFIAYGFGYNVSENNTTYPVLYKKGLFTILLLLHDAGILSKQIIPKLF